MSLMACEVEYMDNLIFSKTRSYGSIYALQFISESDDVTVAIDGSNEEITVKGLKYKYLVKFSDVKSVTYKGNAGKGMLMIQTLEKTNEIGFIDELDFDVIAEEIKSRSFNLNLEKL